MLRQAVVLAGGEYSRLDGQPSGMSDPTSIAGDHQLLDVLVRNLVCFGLREIVIVAGDHSGTIEDYFDDGSTRRVRIQYAHQTKVAGTGSFLRLLADQLDERFLLLNGNTFFDVNYLDLAMLQAGRQSLCAIALRRADGTAHANGMQLHGERVSGPSDEGGTPVVDGGVYLMTRAVAEYVSGSPCSLTKDVLPRMVAEARVVGRHYDGLFVDGGAAETSDEYRRMLASWWRKPIAFFDRDGVINRDAGYVNSPDHFEWVAGAPEAIRLLNDSGYRVVVVTNQSGIARGYYDESAFRRLMDWIAAELQSWGGHIDATYFCPHHPTQGIRSLLSDCDCRKPKPGMLLRALRDFPADPDDCFLVGDKSSDLQAAAAVGVTGYRFDGTENLAEFIVRSHDRLRVVNDETPLTHAKSIRGA